MKKGIVFVFFLILFVSFFTVGCMDLIIGLTPPAPKTPQVDGMTVTLSWDAVANATSYLLSVDLVSADQNERIITFPDETVVNGTSHDWTAPGPGDYSWKVRARNDKGESRWISGQNFTIDIAYDAPTVDITYPLEGQIANSLTPTIEWTAEPGTLTQAPLRAFEVDACEVVISENDEQIHTGSGVQGTGNAWSYQMPAGVLDYGKTYSLKVTASQQGALADGEDEKTFKAPTGIGLELSDTSLYNCGIITATVTAYDPDIDKVALFGKLESDQDYLQIAPPAGWRDLDANRQAVFTLETTDLGVGNWLINAQSSGSSSKSVEKTLEIKEITLIPEIDVNMCDRTIENGDYVYIDADTSFPATVAYSIDINLDEQLEGMISEFFYVFEYAGDFTMVSTSSTYNFDTWEATDIVMTMATECTKVATVTVHGTSTCNDHYSGFVYEPVSISFTLDAALPEINFVAHQFESEKKLLTIPVHIQDTKSLCQATMSFFVEKVNAQKQQMSGWTLQNVPWGVETVTIGTGDNQVDGTITYSDPIVFGETTTLDATVLLALGDLDGATLTSTITAIDCCDSCTNVCSNGEIRKPSAESLTVFFDNIFYRKQFVNISFFDNNDFSVLGDSWLLTIDNDTGLASFCFADAYFDDPDDLEFYLSGDVAAVSVDGTDTMATDVIAECTGYPFKNELCILMSMTAIHGTETSVEAQFVATDTNNNSTELVQHILIDTQAPQLATADGHLGQKAGNSSDDYVEFAFRASDKGQMPTFEGATVTVDGNPNKKQWYEYLGSVYDYEDQRGIVQLNEDHQFRVNFDESSYGLNEGGTVSIEINASDKYGNTGYTSFTGDVYNP